MAAATLSHLVEQLRLGDTFTTAGRTVTEADIVSFVTQTGELHPIHIDAEWAASSVFGERVAPGALTLSYGIGLVRLNPERAIALRGITDVVFTRPVRIGDTLTVEGKVISATPSDPGASIVTLTLSILNQHRQIVCRARLQIKWKGDLSTR